MLQFQDDMKLYVMNERDRIMDFSSTIPQYISVIAKIALLRYCFTSVILKWSPLCILSNCIKTNSKNDIINNYYLIMIQDNIQKQKHI